MNLGNGDEHGREPETRKAIKAWASERRIDFVAWTDLESSFSQQAPDQFVAVAMTHLKSLDLRGLRQAVKYVVKAPRQTDTRLRQVLMNDEWFKEQVALYNKDP